VHFLERVGASEDRHDDQAGRRHLVRESRWSMHDYWFGEALGELRAAVGLQAAIIAASYGLDVETTWLARFPTRRGSCRRVGAQRAHRPARTLLNNACRPGH